MTHTPLTNQQLDNYEAAARNAARIGSGIDPAAVLELAAQVRRLRAELAAITELHEKGEHNGLDICLHCASQMFPPPETGIWSESAWPCATLRALGVGVEPRHAVPAAVETGE